MQQHPDTHQTKACRPKSGPLLLKTISSSNTSMMTAMTTRPSRMISSRLPKISKQL